jgi:hypothetical protein
MPLPKPSQISADGSPRGRTRRRRWRRDLSAEALAVSEPSRRGTEPDIRMRPSSQRPDARRGRWKRQSPEAMPRCRGVIHTRCRDVAGEFQDGETELMCVRDRQMMWWSRRDDVAGLRVSFGKRETRGHPNRTCEPNLRKRERVARTPPSQMSAGAEHGEPDIRRSSRRRARHPQWPSTPSQISRSGSCRRAKSDVRNGAKSDGRKG